MAIRTSIATVIKTKELERRILYSNLGDILLYSGVTKYLLKLTSVINLNVDKPLPATLRNF